MGPTRTAAAPQPRPDTAPTAIDRSRELQPWQRAYQFQRCFLYWMPAVSFPMPEGPRRWVLQFLERLAAALADQFGWRPNWFVQYKGLRPEMQAGLVRAAGGLPPLAGLARRAGALLPRQPPREQMARLLQRPDYDMWELVPDYCYWIPDAKWEEVAPFAGHGATTLLFRRPDPKATPLFSVTGGMKKHPVAQWVDLERAMAATAALGDEFLAQSKKLFGGGLENDPQFPGLSFVLPHWNTRDFFQAPEGEVAKLFQLCEVYFSESPVDKGLLLATKADHEATILQLVRELRGR